MISHPSSQKDSVTATARTNKGKVHDEEKKGIRDAGSTADFRILFEKFEI